MSVIARGAIRCYKRDGVYQIYVQAMQEDGVGILYKKYEELKQRVRQNDSEIINRTHNVSISSTTKIGLSIGYGINATCYFKNIIVKAL